MGYEELAWTAGFFDGEGYIGISNNGGIYKRISMSVSQVDPYVLERMKSTLGGNVKGPYKYREKDSPLWHWTISRFEIIQQAVASMWLWLSPVKKLQCATALGAFVTYSRSLHGH